ncbi:MAG: VWA domain-containing protein [Myxococcales bacterium]|nr:VWA domain-containing protein [Myxococcales bacterium]
MFVDFLYELRRRGVKVGPQEGIALAQALDRDLHGTSLDGFYQIARALLVHREQDLDAFDAAFATHFQGVTEEAIRLTDEVLDWLRDAAPRRPLTDEERALLEKIDLVEARRRLEQRLLEQRERHDGGKKWVGTGGASPHGRGGEHPNGIRVGEGERGGQGAMRLATERRFRDLRGDVTLDTRQIEQALRRLRAFARDGAPDELDLAGTIDATAKNAGELEVKLQAPRRSNVRVLLLLDVGGSMDPHAEVCSRLFSAAKRATHFKELKILHFHNCLYGRVYPTAALRGGIALPELLQACDPTWRLIVVGDALMHPSELFADGGTWTYDEWGDVPGVAWLQYVASHFQRSAWLNPEPETAWHGTAATIAKLFPMYRLTLDGLTEAVARLSRGGRRR